MRKKTYLFFLFLTAFSSFVISAVSQPAWTIDLLGKQKKPEKFENRKLGSEKMAEKKFTPTRHFFQNNFTHYNYFFNANNKINAVIEKAKYAQIDNFSNLLSFYPYSLNNTASQTSELDSVIFKATAGILLHDLRNDWIDNMYLLMGKAYFLRKDFDSAGATFQFINYNLYPRKKHEDDDKIIGTNYDAASSKISIANKEKQNLLQKMVSKPPSRNDALLWLARTLIEQEEYGEAAGLIKTLQNDPNLPKRLQNDLDELYAYWFYRQNTYDSAAAYLEKGLSVADTKQDKSRSEFLLAQLFERTRQFDKATIYYDKASKHTTNPLLDIFANLNEAKMQKGTNDKELDNSIENLIHMAKKDKYSAYRDIIYCSAGDLFLQKPDTANAILLYNKSLQYNESNVSYKNKVFLQLADIAYDRKQFKVAFADYDSLQTGDTALTARAEEIKTKRNALSAIVEKINIIEREDSLQRVASMQPDERDAFIKKLSKKLRKQLGLKEEVNSGGVIIGFDNPKDKPAELFTNNDTKGEWYFYNSSLKSKGLNEFKAKWGTRSNVDNWRRKSAVDAAGNIDNSVLNPDVVVDNVTNKPAASAGKPADQDVSYDGLLADVPLTPEKMTESHKILSSSLFELAGLYQNSLEDFEMAIATYDESLQRYPDSLHNGEIYLGLYYCYNKLGNNSKSAYYKNLLTGKFKDSYSAKVLTNPAQANPVLKNEVATKRYENIYNLFIEGKFDQALSEKKNADSLYGKNYWSAQLLYIEAVYHIKQREDSIAKTILQNIITLYPSSPLKQKSTTLIDVLGRRAEIEKYLTELQVTRQVENEPVVINENKTNPVATVQQSAKDSNNVTVNKPLPVKVDGAKTDIPKPAVPEPFIFNAAAPQNIVMVLNKVDPTYINETKNALNGFNSDNFRGQNITIKKEVLDGDNTILIFSSFTDAEAALQYLVKIKKAAPSEISWLPAAKYYFIISSDENLEKLRINKNLSGYKDLLIKQYPGKF